MKKLRWQLIIVIIALIAIGILLFGQQPVLQAIVPEPATGGLYTEALIGSISRLNPVLDFYNTVDQDVDRLVYSSLIRFDAHGNPTPDLAESWGISVDGLVYNFKLRPDLVWHDGAPLTANDVAFTVALLSDPEMPVPDDIKTLWEDVEVVVFDERNLQFRLPNAFAPFLDYLDFGIVPQHLLEGMSTVELIDAQFNLAPIGSGPYQFEQLLVEDGQISGVVLYAFEDYYDERAFIDQVIFLYFPDSATAFTAYQDGEVQGISSVSLDVLPEALAEPELNMYTGVVPRLSLVFLNLDNQSVPFFQDVAVREALLTGLNRRWIIGRILEGQGILADSPIFPGSWAYNEEVGHVEYDPDKAISLLKNAGYVIPAEGSAVRELDGERLSFELVYPDTDLHAEIAEAIQRDWERLGVDVNLVAEPYDVLVQDYLEPRDYEAALIDIDLAGTPDPDPYPFWHQSQANSGQNYSQWDDRRASEYLEQARVTPRITDRIRMYKNFQVHFSRELPALLLYFPVYNYAVADEVQGIQIGPVYEPNDRFVTIGDWFLLARGGGGEATEGTLTPEVTTEAESETAP
ncbi:MAG: peptide ABC transporter substrate-binding protein [Anaerolineales bacterium]|nr:peptide ABC transporter substrate-binding protein [Anaerolineales bacterium]